MASPSPVQKRGRETSGNSPYRFLLYVPGFLFLAVFMNSRLAMRQVDVPQYYAVAHIVRAGNIDRLYDPSSYAGFVSLAGDGALYYNRPAFHALATLPFAYISYQTFLVTVRVGCYAAFVMALWLLPRWFPRPHGRALLVAFLPFLWTMTMGQDTIVLALIVGFGAHLLLNRGKDFEGGAVMALAVFKPHVVWGIPVALAVQKRWRALAGFMAMAVSLALLSFALVGPHGVEQWIAVLRAPTTDMAADYMSNVRAVFRRLGVVPAASVALVAAVSFAICIWRRSLQIALSAALFVGPLLVPHSYVCDYSPAAIAGLLAPYPLLSVVVLAPWHAFVPGRPTGIPYAFTACVFLAATAWSPMLKLRR